MTIENGVYILIDEILESLELDIVLNEGDWCRNPQNMYKLFHDKIIKQYYDINN